MIAPELAQSLPTGVAEAERMDAEEPGQALGPTTKVDHKLKLIGEEMPDPRRAALNTLVRPVGAELMNEGPLRKVLRDDDESFLPRGRQAPAPGKKGPDAHVTGSAYSLGQDTIIMKKKGGAR